MRIFIDPFKLNKYDLSATDVQNIVASQNINQGAGKLVNDQKETVLKVKADAISVEDLQELIKSMLQNDVSKRINFLQFYEAGVIQKYDEEQRLSTFLEEYKQISLVK